MTPRQPSALWMFDLHLAPERAVADVVVEVLDHGDARLRRRGDVVEIVEPLSHVVAERHLVLGLRR